MKKLIALIATLSILITMTGCGTNDVAPPPDNKYVAMAKEYGYWHGMGGISWGMSIDETLAVLNVKREDTVDVPNEYSDMLAESTIIGVEMTVHSIPSKVRFHYYKAVNEVGTLSEKEWLWRIEVVFDKEQLADDITLLVQEELKALNMSYKEGVGKFQNKQSLLTLSDKEQGEKAIDLYNSLIVSLPNYKDASLKTKEESLDRIMFLQVGEQKSVVMLSYNGYPAAILAKSH